MDSSSHDNKLKLTEISFFRNWNSPQSVAGWLVALQATVRVSTDTLSRVYLCTTYLVADRPQVRPFVRSHRISLAVSIDK